MEDAATLEQLREGASDAAPSEMLVSSAKTEHGLAIVIADRGWVWVGTVTSDYDFTTIEGARCVRRWGTSKGLGELAKLGPRPDTALDDPVDMKVASRAVIAIVPCEQSAWTA
jgi:hypothetical protein